MSGLNQNNNKVNYNKINRKFTYLSFEERKHIQKMKWYILIWNTYVKYNNWEELSNREIWRILWRSHTTIWDEIKRYFEDYPSDKFYKAEKAHKLFLKRQLNKWNKFKLIDNSSSDSNSYSNSNESEEWNNFKYKKLKNYVINSLKEWHSPEQISWRIETLKLESELWWSVSHETIYNFIYNSPEWKEQKLYQYLRRHRKKRIKYWSRRKWKKWWNIKNLIKISERDKNIAIRDRKEIWHWESDSMIFVNQKYILSVQVERKSRFVFINKLKNKTAEETLKSLNDLYNYLNNDVSKYWLNIVKTITFDRWLEWAYHYELNKKYWIKTYFCNPYSSRQKWSVENMNMFIREYFPRNIDMNNITDDHIKYIQDKLNNRPRKCLNYLTPKEFLEIEINKEIKKQWL